MYVEIIARSADKDDSQGKTSWLSTGDKPLAPKLCKTKPSHLGKPAWHVEVNATDWREYGSGMQGGEMKLIKYKLEVALTPADLTALVNFALANQLVEVVAARRVAKRR